VALLSGGVITAVGTHSHLLATVPEYRDVLSAAAESDDESHSGGSVMTEEVRIR
jgi:ATP-binding cassette subfamily B protein